MIRLPARARCRVRLGPMSAAELDAAGPPNSWLVPAVVSTLLCFPITGVIGVYFAAQVRVRWDLGDLDGADVAARRALDCGRSSASSSSYC